MATKIRYEWTGDFEPPKQDEYYLEPDGSLGQATLSFHKDNKHFILRRVEVEKG